MEFLFLANRLFQAIVTFFPFNTSKTAVYAGFFWKLSFHSSADPSPLKVPGTQLYLSFTPCTSS
jgi:hypothetical protein